MPKLFITGTDTGVGKTRIGAGLCLAFAAAGMRVAAMKPVASGCTRTRDGLRSEDALALLAAMNLRATYADVNPYAFEPPVAPHIAAAESGNVVDFDVLDRCYQRLALQSDVIIVEGAGGWLAPIDDARTFADLAVRWELDVVLVVGLRLGCLNHALLSVEAIERRGSRLCGWVANSVTPDLPRRDENVAALRTRINAPCIGTYSYSPASTAQDVAQSLIAKLPELDLTQPP